MKGVVEVDSVKHVPVEITHVANGVLGLRELVLKGDCARNLDQVRALLNAEEFRVTRQSTDSAKLSTARAHVQYSLSFSTIHQLYGALCDFDGCPEHRRQAIDPVGIDGIELLVADRTATTQDF